MRYFMYGLLSILVITSCGESSAESQEVKVEDQSPKTPQKMIANPETSEGMLMIQHMIISFNEMQPENKNYAVLLGELSYQCDYIIKNCSMKGEEHEKLHTVLEPILTSVQKSKNADSNEKIEVELQNILSMTELYFEKFEVEQAQV